MSTVPATLAVAFLLQTLHIDWRLPELFPSRGPVERTVALDPGDPALPDRGPFAEFRYAALWDVTLKLEARADHAGFGLFLEVVDLAGELLANDEEGEGGSVAALEVALPAGRRVRVRLGAVDPHAGGTIVLSAEETPAFDSWVNARTLFVPPPPGPQLQAALEEAQRRFALAATQADAGQHAAARTELRELAEALAATPGAADSREVVVLAWSVGQQSHLFGDAAFARTLFEKVVTFLERTLRETDVNLQGARVNLATMISESGQPTLARALAETAVLTLERSLPPDDADLPDVRVVLASLMSGTDDAANAHAINARAIAAWEGTRPEHDPSLLLALRNQALNKEKLGDPKGARSLLEKVIAVQERTLPEDHLDLLIARRELATLLGDLGHLRSAHAIIERVHAAMEQALPEENLDRLRARQHLMVSLHAVGDDVRARTIGEALLPTLERLLPEDHRLLLHTREALAVVVSNLGDSAGARALEEEVLAARERFLPPDHPDLQKTRMNLAGTLKDLGRLDEAKALEEQVLASRSRSLPDDHPDLQLIRTNVANTLHLGGDSAGARALLEKVVSIQERMLANDHRHLRASRLNLATTLNELGDLESARELFERILSETGPALPLDDPQARLARQNLLWTLDALDEPAPLAGVASALLAGVERWTAAARLRGKRESLEMIGATDAQVSTLLSLAQAARRGGGDLAARLFELVEAQRAVIAEPNLDLLETRGDAAIRTLHERARELRTFVANAAAAREDLAPAIRQRDAVEAELRAACTAAGRLAPSVSRDAIAAALPRDGAAVAYRTYTSGRSDPAVRHRTVATRSLLAHVVRKDGTLARVELGPVAAIESCIGRWRAALGHPLGATRGFGEIASSGGLSDSVGAELRKLILAPVVAAAGDARVLHVCVDGVLHLVPLDALPLDDKGIRRVGDEYRVHVEVSFARLMRKRETLPGASTLLAFGGIDYDQPAAEAMAGRPSPLLAAAPPVGTPRTAGKGTGFGFLESTNVEADRIAALHREAFGGSPVVLSRSEASKAALARLAPAARFLHVATHGYFASEDFPALIGPADRTSSLDETVRGLAPMTLCGLAFAGANLGIDSQGRVPGILTAEELAGLDLSTCELAVLSACETNVGLRRAGLGIHSLQSALHAAGARTAVTSLWKVADEPTSRLMEDFYRRVWKEKEGKAEALWNAKKTLRERGAPLGDWAGWVLTGDPE